MKRQPARRALLISLLGTLAAWACNGGERAGPSLSSLKMEKAPSGSGDQQTAVGGTALPDDLRVLVSRDGDPVESVKVAWSTSEGFVVPQAAFTDTNGISATRWTLELLLAEQAAVATLDRGEDSLRLLFTALALPGPAHGKIIQVLSEGGNRFEPADLTITAGTTVNWLWPAGSSGHNVVPDDGDTPPQTGPLESGPRSHSFTFTLPGVYRYHCMAHGAAGGVGMSGTVTVLPPGPEPAEIIQPGRERS